MTVDSNCEWDAGKAAQNWQKHGVSFEEAATVFLDPLAITRYDIYHSVAEERFVTLGQSTTAQILVVVHTERLPFIRIISARRATPKERRDYATVRE